MKPLRKALRLWIAAASVFTFFGGWILLAHSPKPVQPTSASTVNSAPLATIAPYQGLGDSSSQGGNGLNQFNLNSQPSTGSPMLRTGGS